MISTHSEDTPLYGFRGSHRLQLDDKHSSSTTRKISWEIGRAGLTTPVSFENIGIINYYTLGNTKTRFYVIRFPESSLFLSQSLLSVNPKVKPKLQLRLPILVPCRHRLFVPRGHVVRTSAPARTTGYNLHLTHIVLLQARQLAGIGGNTPRTATARILAKLFEDSRGQKYSLYGQKGKRAFATVELFSVLQKAVRLIKGLSGATLEEIEAGAKGWLKNCRARVNSATKRCGT
ncbi:unnamed protein product [Ixodes pacificus]